MVMIMEEPLFPSEDKEKKQKEKERKLHEKIKRFNDIFSMLFLVITIVISVGAIRFPNENLSFTIIFTMLSLGFWMFGHAIGYKYQDLEVQVKISAWVFASLVASTVLLKFAIGVSALSLEWSSFCIFVSIVLTILSSLYFKEVIFESKQPRLTMIVLLFFGIIYAVYIYKIIL